MPKIALCSDSNGTTAYVSQPQLYLTLIASGLGFPNVANYSVSGQTSAQIKAQVQQAIADGASLVLINAGTNDFSQGYNQPAEPILANILANVSQMIGLCKAAGAQCVVMSPILPNTLTQVRRHVELGERLAALCLSQGVDYVPVVESMLAKFDGSNVTGWYTGADWHGTAIWHQFVADLVLTRQHGLASAPLPPATGILFDLVTTGANGSTAFTDASPFQRPITALGNAQIQGNKATFDGVGDALQIPDIAELAGASDFSIRAEDVTFNAANGVLFMQRQAPGDYLIFHTNAGSLLFQAIVASGVTPPLINATAVWTPTPGVQYASIEVRRIAGVISLFVNDAVLGSPINNAVALPNFAAPVTVAAATGGLNGMLRRMLITRT